MNGRMLNMLLAEDNIGGIFGAFPIIKTIMILFVFEGNKCLGFDSRQIEYYAGLNTSKARK